mgnify:CR=1 FL=1
MSQVATAFRFPVSCRIGINERPAAVAGNGSLLSGRVMSLRPRRPAVLHVRQGLVWATLGVRELWRPGESGDHFLSPGECLHVPAGARLVLEVVAGQPGTPARFDWTEA